MDDFNEIWQTYIMPLKNKKVYTVSNHAENTITNVTWEYLERISSEKTAPRKIKIDIFRSCYSHILKNGEITRDEINHLYPKRISSIIFAVLAEIPFFDIISTPKAKKTLVWDK